MSKELTHLEFTTRAIFKLRDISKSKGIHVVYSGFNKAFRDYFNEDPIQVIDQLVEKGFIEKRIRRGGPMIFLKGEAPGTDNDTDDVLDTILE